MHAVNKTCVHTSRNMRQSLHDAVLGLLLLLPQAVQSGHGMVQLSSDAVFEDTVLSAPRCWAVLFTSKTRESELKQVVDAVQTAVSRLGDEVHFGTADVDDIKAISSEFGVRKRLTPRLLIFATRARQAEVMRLTPGTKAEDFMAEITGMFAENERGPEGFCRKATLAIGEREEL